MHITYTILPQILNFSLDSILMVINTVKFDSFFSNIIKSINLYAENIHFFVAYRNLAYKHMQVLKCSSDKLTAKINWTSRRWKLLSQSYLWIFQNSDSRLGSKNIYYSLVKNKFNYLGIIRLLGMKSSSLIREILTWIYWSSTTFFSVLDFRMFVLFEWPTSFLESKIWTFEWPGYICIHTVSNIANYLGLRTKFL